LRAREDGPTVAVRQHREGAWRDTTWSELRDEAAAFGSGLLELGIGKGDRVGLALKPCVEGLIALLGIQGVGATPFGIYPTTPLETVDFLVETAEGRAAVIEPAWEPHFRRRAIHTVVPGADTGDELLALGRSRHAAEPREWEQLVAGGRGDDTWTIYFTSGTTGRPKGVPLSDRMVMTAGYFDLFGHGEGLLPPPTPRDRTFHEIPLASVAGPIFGLYYGLVFGCTAHIPEDPTDATAALREASPTIFLTFPRMWELRMSEALANVQGRSALRRGVYAAAMRVREATAARQQAGRRASAPLRLADAFAYRVACRPLLEGWGFASLGLVLTGGATLAPELIRQWRRWGVVIRQIYGQTESGGLATIQTERFPPPGYAGRPGPRMDVRVDADGEILVRGEGVFRGYLGLPEATAAALDEDGWFYSGDAGVIAEDGNLRVLDRKSDLIVLDSGRTVVASELESVLKQSRYVRNAVVVGGGEADLVALIELDDAAAREWGRRHDLAETEYEGLAQSPEVVALVEAELAAANEQLAAAEQPCVRAVRLLPSAIDLDDPMQATPTRKVRRAQLALRYQDLVEEMRAVR
jgi:long-chain acyl-CoA synthetase